MSDRLTKKWTKTLEEAFGASGAKGEIGENFAEKFLKDNWQCTVERYPDSHEMQTKGIDLSFSNSTSNTITADIKNNLTDSGTFWVYEDWLLPSQADRIIHVNPGSGEVAWYDTQAMKDYFKQSYTYKDKNGKFYRSFRLDDQMSLPEFIKKETIN